jgi:hypothetical protein
VVRQEAPFPLAGQVREKRLRLPGMEPARFSPRSLSSRHARPLPTLRVQPPAFIELPIPSPTSHQGGSIVVVVGSAPCLTRPSGFGCPRITADDLMSSAVMGNDLGEAVLSAFNRATGRARLLDRAPFAGSIGPHLDPRSGVTGKCRERKSALCSRFRGVSDRTRTGDHLDHNQ